MTIRELYDLALRTGHLDDPLFFTLDDNALCEVHEVEFTADGEAILDE